MLAIYSLVACALVACAAVLRKNRRSRTANFPSRSLRRVVGRFDGARRRRGSFKPSRTLQDGLHAPPGVLAASQPPRPSASPPGSRNEDETQPHRFRPRWNQHQRTAAQAAPGRARIGVRPPGCRGGTGLMEPRPPAGTPAARNERESRSRLDRAISRSCPGQFSRGLKSRGPDAVPLRARNNLHRLKRPPQ